MTKQAKTAEQILKVSIEEYKERMAICAYCPSYRSMLGGVCGENGKMMPLLARFTQTECKLSKWK